MDATFPSYLKLMRIPPFIHLHREQRQQKGELGDGHGSKLLPGHNVTVTFTIKVYVRYFNSRFLVNPRFKTLFWQRSSLWQGSSSKAKQGVNTPRNCDLLVHVQLVGEATTLLGGSLKAAAGWWPVFPAVVARHCGASPRRRPPDGRSRAAARPQMLAEFPEAVAVDPGARLGA